MRLGIAEWKHPCLLCKDSFPHGVFSKLNHHSGNWLQQWLKRLKSLCASATRPRDGASCLFYAQARERRTKHPSPVWLDPGNFPKTWDFGTWIGITFQTLGNSQNPHKSGNFDLCHRYINLSKKSRKIVYNFAILMTLMVFFKKICRPMLPVWML